MPGRGKVESAPRCLGRAGAMDVVRDMEHLPAGASVLVTREVGLMAGISGKERQKYLKDEIPSSGGDNWAKTL